MINFRAMTKSTGNNSLAPRPTSGRWLRAFLGLAMLFATATQVAAIPIAHADAGTVLFRTVDLQAEPDGSGGPLHPDNDCATFACHGAWFVASSDGELLIWPGAPANLDRDQSVAGNVILPPLHPPKISPRV